MSMDFSQFMNLAESDPEAALLHLWTMERWRLNILGRGLMALQNSDPRVRRFLGWLRACADKDDLGVLGHP